MPITGAERRGREDGTSKLARTLIVAPEPVDWLASIRSTLGGRVLAPWALPDRIPATVSGRHDFLRRRIAADAHSWFPAFTALEVAVRAYVRGKAARQFAGRFATRAAVDRLVAAALRREAWPGLRRVVAPSLAARRTFAAARERGMQCVLLEDAPDLWHLAQTLDEQAERHPECPFLRNHRPHRRTIVDQRAERELAHAIGVRGAHAWNRLEPRAGSKLFGLGVAIPPAQTHGTMPGTVMLAGPPVGRSGTMHLHALASRLPTMRFLVAPGPDAEPVGLFDHPRVVRMGRTERERLEPSVVLSLTCVESHPWEVRHAIALGRPIVGTAPSVGQAVGGRLVDANDLDGVADAIRQARVDTNVPTPWVAPVGLPTAFERLQSST